MKPQQSVSRSHFPSARRVVALAAMVSLTCSFAAAANAQAGKPAGHAPGRILLMPQAGLPEQALQNLLKEAGAGNGRRVGQSNLRIVEVPQGQEDATVRRLARNPHVKFAELDRYVPASGMSNDPYLGSQWHLAKIGAPLAWDTSQGSGVTIAILDSGVESAHPDLADRLVAGYNFVEGNTNTEDVRGHGTRVAGSAAATLNNGTGVASVAGLVKVMPIRISDSTGYTTFSRTAQGITYAADRGARVANVSFGGTITSSSVLSAAQYMKDRNGLVFFSAGNDATDPLWTKTTSAVVVSSTDSADNLSSFSSYGGHVHLSAPGSGIFTTTNGQTYASVSGTSFSAPVAAGVAALVMATNAGLTSSQVESILFSTAVDLGAAGRDAYFGHGRVDAAAAVAAARTTTPTTVDTTAPSVAISAPSASSSVSGLASVSVSASDNVNVAKTELYVNGSLLATDSVAPFGFSWDTTRFPNGTATLEARAYDAAGNVGRSAPVGVNVGNAVVVDGTAPTLLVKNPVDGSQVSGSITVSAASSDNAGLTGLRMELSIDGSVVASSVGTGSLGYKWNTRRAAAGTHVISFKATDAAGNTATKSISVQR